MNQQEKEKGLFCGSQKTTNSPTHSSKRPSQSWHFPTMHRFWKSLQDQSLLFSYIYKKWIKHKKCQCKRNILIILPGCMGVVKKPIYLVTPFHYEGVFVKVSKIKTTTKGRSKDNNINEKNSFAWQRGGPCSWRSWCRTRPPRRQCSPAAPGWSRIPRIPRHLEKNSRWRRILDDFPVESTF